MVTCDRFSGGTIEVEAAALEMRPSTYGLVLNDNSILVSRSRGTGKLRLPGGGVEKGEKIVEALKREVTEETGLEIQVNSFIYFTERFFHNDPSNSSYQCYLFFFDCTPRTFEISPCDSAPDSDLHKAEWISCSELSADKFHSYGDFIIDYLKNRGRVSWGF